MKNLLYITEIEDKNLPLLFAQQIQRQLDITIASLNDPTVDYQDLLTNQFDLVAVREPYGLYSYKQQLTDVYLSLESYRGQILDGVRSWEEVLIFADKYRQYQILGEEFFPFTTIDKNDIRGKEQEYVAKKAVSSRGKDVDVIIDQDKEYDDFIFQKKVKIQEEFRVIYCNGSVMPVGVKKISKRTNDAPIIIGEELRLSQEVQDFSQAASNEILSHVSRSQFQLLGLDVAVLVNKTIKLIEINRSPIVTRFFAKTGINLYEKLLLDLNF